VPVFPNRRELARPYARTGYDLGPECAPELEHEVTMTTASDRSSSTRRLTRQELTRLRMVIGRLGRVLRQQTDDDLPYALISLLFAIGRSQPVTAGDLAASERVTPPSISRSLERLDRLGLITRKPWPEDRRVSVIQLTLRGRAELKRILHSREVWLSDHVARLTGEELDLLMSAVPVLERLCDPALPNGHE